MLVCISSIKLLNQLQIKMCIKAHMKAKTGDGNRNDIYTVVRLLSEMKRKEGNAKTCNTE